MDMSEGHMTRKEAIAKNLDMNVEANEYMCSMLSRAEGIVDSENPFKIALEAFSSGHSDESTRKMIEENPEYNRIATIAEEFDNLLMSRFYKSLSYGMVIRMNEYELERIARRGETNADKEAKLKENIAFAEAEHRALTEQLEKELDYEVVPIRKLVSIQLECGLLLCDYLHDKATQF